MSFAQSPVACYAKCYDSGRVTKDESYSVLNATTLQANCATICDSATPCGCDQRLYGYGFDCVLKYILKNDLTHCKRLQCRLFLPGNVDGRTTYPTSQSYR